MKRSAEFSGAEEHSMFGTNVQIPDAGLVAHRGEDGNIASTDSPVVAKPSLSEDMQETGRDAAAVFSPGEVRPEATHDAVAQRMAEDEGRSTDGNDASENVRQLPGNADTHFLRQSKSAAAAAAGIAVFSVLTAACSSEPAGGKTSHPPGIVQQLEQAGKNAVHGVEKDAGRLAHGAAQAAHSVGPRLGRELHHAEQQGQQDGKHLLQKGKKLGSPSPSPRPSQPRG